MLDTVVERDPPQTCRLNSRRRTSGRIPWSPGDRLRVDDALKVFRARTGRDPESDAALRSWIFFVVLGLDAEAGSSRVRAEIEHEAPQSPRKRRRGHPDRNPLLTSALAGLVDDVGASNAALLLMLYGCDVSRAFPILRASAMTTREVLRRLEQHLSKIRGKARRRPTPDLSIVLRGASLTSIDAATGTFRGSVPGSSS